MNIEREFKVSPKKLTNRQLRNTLWDFANVLAANRWQLDAVPHVELTRSIVESVGFEQIMGQHEVTPIFNEIVISFSATKREAEYRGKVFMLPYYHITSTVLQDIESSEIPRHVLDEMFKEVNDDDYHPVHDLLDDYGIDEDTFSSDNLDDFEIKRQQEASYEIDHNGEIQEYTLSFSYTFDDAVAHEARYDSSSGEFMWAPVPLHDGESLERRPLIVPLLTQQEIETDMQRVDSEFEAFLLEKSLRELTEFSSVPPEEHIRRIMGMVGMVSSGFSKRPK